MQRKMRRGIFVFEIISGEWAWMEEVLPVLSLQTLVKNIYLSYKHPSGTERTH